MEHTQLFGAQWGLKALSATSLGARLSGKAIRSQVEHMARTFIAGATVEEAAPRLTDLWQHGRAWSVDLLGEATISDREADRYRDRCMEALTLLAREAALWPSLPLLERDHLGPIPRVQLSIKISALSPHLDPIDPEGSYRSVAARLRPILDLAMRLPASLIFDMEQAETKALLVEIFTRLFAEPSYKDYPYAGLALQAYHRETARDIEGLLAWVRRRGAPITIRLVKGAYWDSDTIRYRQRGWAVPLFEHKVETDANYEALTRLYFISDIPDSTGLRDTQSPHVSLHRGGCGVARALSRDMGISDDLRHGRALSACGHAVWAPIATLYPGGRSASRHGLSRTAVARKHLERIISTQGVCGIPIL